MPWDRTLTIILAGVLGVATLVLGFASTQMFGTNSRIDAIYPTLATQAGDIGEIKGDLRVAANSLDRASKSIEAIEERLSAAADRLERVAQEVERSVAAQLDQGQRIDELVSAVNTNTDMLGDVIDRLDRLEPISVPYDPERQGMLNVEAAKWADLKSALEKAGYGVVNFDELDRMLPALRSPKEGVTVDHVHGPPAAIRWSDVWLVSPDPETALKLQEPLIQR